MKNINAIYLGTIIMTLLISCTTEDVPKGPFASDVEFLKEHHEVILLQREGGKCQVAVVPAFQGRIVTSTSNGNAGRSYGWINRKHIAADTFTPHINAFGGEDRFWLGPEGGQFSLFFKPNTDFTFENWFTPAAIDTEPFDIVGHDSVSVQFEKQMHLTNYAGSTFDLDVRRNISILTRTQIESNLNIAVPEDVAYVGFQSDNTIKNTGDSAWAQETGLLSIWILGMFIPSPYTTVIVPFRDSLNINTKYFGEIGPDRLKVMDNVVLFRGDGQYRCKLGIPPQNAMPYAGSYDAENHILTIVHYTFTQDSLYVNSLWEHQDNPYGGDVFNSYNDGPVNGGPPLGPFYELETSSSAKPLAPGEQMSHVHATYHFEGSPESLNTIAQKTLGTNLDSVSGAFQ